MTEKKTVVWVNTDTLINRQVKTELENNLDVNCITVTHATDLFPLLSNCTVGVDLVVFDIEQLYDTKGIDIYDIINTVSTLSKCTVARNSTGKPSVRNCAMAAAISTSTKSTLIKELNSTEVKGVVPTDSGSTEKYKALAELLSGKTYYPKKFSGVESKKSRDSINLTPRQQQVLNLIQERGASNKTIAKLLNLSESTVKLHVTQVMKKYGVKNRTQLALFAIKTDA